MTVGFLAFFARLFWTWVSLEKAATLPPYWRQMYCMSECSTGRKHKLRMRKFLPHAILISLATLLAACNTPSVYDDVPVNRSAGSSTNIASLTAVIDSNPSDATAYSTRGIAYGQAGILSAPPESSPQLPVSGAVARTM